MICQKCGAQVDDRAKFCPKCGASVTRAQVPPDAFGTPVGYEAPRPAGAPNPRPGPAPRKRRKKSVLPVVLVVVALVVAAAVVTGLVLFRSPKAQLAKAVVSSVDAYKDGMKKIPVAQSKEIFSSQAFDQTVRLEVDSHPDEIYNGLGLSVSTGVSLPDHQAWASVTPFLGSLDLFQGQMTLDDSTLAIGCPELLGKNFYGFDTMKLPVENPLYYDDVETFGLNLFDMAEVYLDYVEEQKGTAAEFTALFTEMMQELEPEKDGSESLDINGKDMKCTRYLLTIPQDLLEDFLLDSVDLLKNTDPTALMDDLIKTMKLPDELKAELEFELGYVDFDATLDDMKDSIEYNMDEIGDAELEIYLHGSKVAAIFWSPEIDDISTDFELYFGGPNDYIDDFSFTMENDYVELSLVSTGSHAGKDGLFTDETTLEIDEEEYTSELVYDSKSDSDNFSWEFGYDMTTLSAEGTLLVDKDAADLVLDAIDLRYDGETYMSLAAEYHLNAYEPMDDVDDPIMLLELDEDELEELAEVLSENAAIWLSDLIDQYPELQDTLEELAWYLS